MAETSTYLSIARLVLAAVGTLQRVILRTPHSMELVVGLRRVIEGQSLVLRKDIGSAMRAAEHSHGFDSECRIREHLITYLVTAAGVDVRTAWSWSQVVIDRGRERILSFVNEPWFDRRDPEGSLADAHREFVVDYVEREMMHEALSSLEDHLLRCRFSAPCKEAVARLVGVRSSVTSVEPRLRSIVVKLAKGEIDPDRIPRNCRIEAAAVVLLSRLDGVSIAHAVSIAREANLKTRHAISRCDGSISENRLAEYSVLLFRHVLLSKLEDHCHLDPRGRVGELRMA